MDCPICFKNIENSVVTNCIHHYCKECINEWCKKKNNCPICRSFIYFIKNDKEFDSINEKITKYHNNKDDDSFFEYNPILIESKSPTDNIKFYNLPISKLPFHKIGLALSGNSFNSVKVVKVDSKAMASFVGIKKGDIIISINNIPAISHEQSIKIIEFNKVIKSDVLLEIIPSKPPNKTFCTPFENLF